MTLRKLYRFKIKYLPTNSLTAVCPNSDIHINDMTWALANGVSLVLQPRAGIYAPLAGHYEPQKANDVA